MLIHMKHAILAGSAAVVGILLASPAVPNASAGITIRFGSPERRLDGERYHTMRALAHYLDEAARTAAQGVSENPRSGYGREGQFVGSINDFARRADDFHARMDRYQSDPWDVPRQVADLQRRAQQVNRQIRRARAFRETWQDWTEVLNTLNLMGRSLQGYDVQVPDAHRTAYRRYGEYDRDSRYDQGQHQHYDGQVRNDDPNRSEPIHRDDGYGGQGFLAVDARQQFRQLAHDMDVGVRRALSIAERDASSYDGGNQEVIELRQFAQQTAEVHRRSDADRVDVREVGPMVQHLLEDARQANDSIRNGDVPREVRSELDQAVRKLEQMAVLFGVDSR
jgi:hypothetical protein